MKKIIFLDLDGTLIDTSNRHYKVYVDIITSSGFTPVFSKDEFWEEKRNAKKTVELIPKGLSQQKFKDTWLNLIENKDYLSLDKPITGIFEVLKELNKDYNLVLVALRKNKENLMGQLSQMGLDRFFDRIIVGSPFDVKEKSELIKSEFVKNEAIIVGDSETDIVAGNLLDIPSFAVLSGIRSERFIKTLNPTFILDSVLQLPERLDVIK